MGKFKDLAIDEANRERSLRGKRSRQRGNAFERDVAARLNGKRVGQYGGKTDVETDAFVIQTKKGNGFFSERVWKWLKELNPKADQIAVVVISDAPGAGTKSRAMAIIDLEDLANWWGKEGE